MNQKVVMVAGPVHPVPPRHGAAVEWWMYQVSQRLRDYEPHIACIAAPGYALAEHRDGVNFHRIRIGRVYKRLFQKITRWDPYSYAQRVARVIDSLRPEIVHVHNAPATFRAVRRHARWRSAHWFLHMHNEMNVAHLADDERLIVASHYLKSWYRERFPETDVLVVTNGVDTALYRPAWELGAESSARQRIAMQLPLDKKIVLYVGRMSPEKGVLDLVRAFRELRRRRADVFLLLVGELRVGQASDQRGEYGRQILAACAEQSEHCRHAGVIDPARMQDVYQVADLAVVPSRFEEPFGMVAIEAMAAGVPVLATPRGGLREFLLPERTGFFIENAQDAASFALQIDQLLSAPQRLDQVRRRARELVENQHSWQIVAHQLEAEYQRALAVRSEPAP